MRYPHHYDHTPIYNRATLSLPLCSCNGLKLDTRSAGMAENEAGRPCQAQRLKAKESML